MHREVVILPEASNRREPLLSPEPSSVGSCCMGFKETVGSTTAECAAVVCCCPCTVMDLLVLAAYRLPAGLCRRALRQRRRRKMSKSGMLPPRRKRCECGCDETDVHIHPLSETHFPELKVGEGEAEKEVMELEMEMWKRFYSAGFWRSPSRRETVSVVSLDVKM